MNIAVKYFFHIFMHKMSKTHLGWSKFLSYFSHCKFLHKDKKTYLGFAQIYSSYCVVQRNSSQKRQQFIKLQLILINNGSNTIYGPNFWCLLCDYGNYKMALSTTVKVWQGDQNRYFNWWVQPQKRMKKHIFSENKCQTLVNKNQEVNSTGTMSRILVNGFQIV